MSFKLIQLLFTFGKFLALTPSKLDLCKESQLFKIYRCLYILSIFILQWTLPVYASLTIFDPVILTTFICLHSMAQLFNIFIMILPMFNKRSLWWQLFHTLKSVKIPKKIDKKIYYRLYFTGIFSMFFMLEILYYYIRSSSTTLGALFKNELPKSTYFFTFFYYNIVIYSILKIILSKYKKICVSLVYYSKEKRNDVSIYLIKKVAESMNNLKSSVNIFNSLFGKPLLIIISYSTIKIISVSVVIIRQSANFKFDHTLIPNFVRLFQILVSSMTRFYQK